MMCSIVGRCRAGGPGDGDDVEAGRVLEKAVRLEIGERGLRHSPLFEVVDCVGGMAGVGRAASLHFDEDDGAAVDRDDIELAQRQIEMPGEDVVAEALKEAGGGSSPRSPSDFGRRAFRNPGAQAHGTEEPEETEVSETEFRRRSLLTGLFLLDAILRRYFGRGGVP